jgi:hypothetical protein
MNMLTISDLSNEQELSSLEMGKVVGGAAVYYGKPVHKQWAGNKMARLASALDPLTHPESQILSSTFVGLED